MRITFKKVLKKSSGICVLLYIQAKCTPFKNVVYDTLLDMKAMQLPLIPDTALKDYMSLIRRY